MKRSVSLVLMLLASLFVVAAPTAAHAKASPTICQAYDSGKIDTTDNPRTVTVTAPEGFLVGGYCAKGGLQTDDVTLDPPTKTVTIAVSNGKAVSHYSVWYVPEEEEPECDPYAPPSSDDACEGSGS